MRNPSPKNHSQCPVLKPRPEVPAPLAAEAPREASMNRAASAPEAKGNTRVRFFGGSETLEQAQLLVAKEWKEEEEFVAWKKRIAEGRLGVALLELYSVTAEFDYLGGEDAVIPPEKTALQGRWWWLRNRKIALEARVRQG